MIKEPSQKVTESIRALVGRSEYMTILEYIRAQALRGATTLPSLTGEDTLKMQGEVKALVDLYKVLNAGKDVFSAP